MARDERGRAMTGTLAAASPEGLADQLKRMGYLVTRSRELRDGATVESVLQKMRRVGYDDLALMNIQLSKMIQVGIPLLTALDTLTQQTDHSRLRDVVGDVARNVEAGTSFSEALKRHPDVFSDLFVNMVHAGEISGKLEEVLRRLADFTKRQAALREQLKTAMTYPLILLVIGVAVTVFLLTGIIPRFMAIFLEAGVVLPLPTMLLFRISEVLRHQGLFLLGALAAAGLGLRAYARTRRGRRALDALLLKLPLVGELARKAALARLTRTLATLFASGIPVLEALAIAQETCGNAVIADVMGHAQASVRQGGAISDPLKVSHEFPPMVVQMITVGEASGTLEQMLAEIAEHYDELIQHGVKRLTTLIEPTFLIVMGGLVAFIMASILLPLFRMVNVIS